MAASSRSVKRKDSSALVELENSSHIQQILRLHEQARDVVSQLKQTINEASDGIKALEILLQGKKTPKTAVNSLQAVLRKSRKELATLKRKCAVVEKYLDSVNQLALTSDDETPNDLALVP